ncbi:imidazole glycerol phosphate synthase subunit HisF [Epilithonimonas ginsengisoli]|uniref:Imidazole glycerol phosphate synthase subunit HisF n=1 Tax=Epilithonimonas ginsengisoli TaxID=1245592 RepID=A0ABU4JCY0_9FLAO|nr:MULTISPECIES: imidazole glycerol phosphate synthase subunit HisF [Chryseobacterium group]MBV6878250.1 imidazole glycerol phosphate synthase subunit HisF [Epilithonimonas sp. FP105]MDW8547509.1 imidazole glycerol phosphate synthase subunit HisF [Epilithonimonas ginsengisoli]OAH68904.1 imidazole glycerol phosphate synthase cyclase subunit [Chryseobacterium sp. FP211-J200]
MLAKRIIPCLDIKNGETVKGVNFLDLKEVGNPVEMAIKYSEQGADELVFLDISATDERRKTLIPLVKEIAKNINIPFTVGGGINALENVEELLKNGADKITINSAALSNPKLISEVAKRFGSQCMVLAIDTKFVGNQHKVFSNGGKIETEKELFSWAKEVENLGAGEILLTSMNTDGTKAGFAIDITKELSALINIPVIASGGAGTMQHFEDVFTETKATGALAASIFHFNEIGIPELKNYLKSKNLPIR